MTVLALRTLRRRAAGFTAGFLAMFFGATILMTFASLLDTRAQPGVDPTSGDMLVIMACVVGGWGLVVVAFAVSSTLTLLVRQRAAETALLKNIGATPAQLTRMITGEAVVVGLVATAAATVPAVFTGRLLVGLLRDAHRIPAGVDAAFGPVAIGMGGGLTLVAAAVGAALAARNTVRLGATEALRDADVDAVRPRRARAVAGLVLLFAGLGCGVATLVAFTGRETAFMAVSGQGAILSSIGFALLAPTLLGALAGPLARVLRRAGIGGHLTAIRLRRQTRAAAGALVPIILFTGIATGTLSMQLSENAAPTPMDPEMARTIEMLNYVVVGIIALFAAVMLVNTLAAATLTRRREFGQLRLAGSTRPQVFGTAGVEGVVLAVTGVLLGSVAAVVTAIPYSLVKTGSVLPGPAVTLYLAVVVTAVALTLATGLGATRQALRRSALESIRTS